MVVPNTFLLLCLVDGRQRRLDGAALEAAWRLLPFAAQMRHRRHRTRAGCRYKVLTGEAAEKRLTPRCGPFLWMLCLLASLPLLPLVSAGMVGVGWMGAALPLWLVDLVGWPRTPGSGSYRRLGRCSGTPGPPGSPESPIMANSG